MPVPKPESDQERAVRAVRAQLASIPGGAAPGSELVQLLISAVARPPPPGSSSADASPSSSEATAAVAAAFCSHEEELQLEGEDDLGQADTAADAIRGAAPQFCLDEAVLSYLLDSELEWRRQGDYTRIFPVAEGDKAYGCVAI